MFNASDIPFFVLLRDKKDEKIQLGLGAAFTFYVKKKKDKMCH